MKRTTKQKRGVKKVSLSKILYQDLSSLEVSKNYFHASFYSKYLALSLFLISCAAATIVFSRPPQKAVGVKPAVVMNQKDPKKIFTNRLAAKVLGTSITSSPSNSKTSPQVPPNLAPQIKAILNQYLAEGKFQGPKGETGNAVAPGTSGASGLPAGVVPVLNLLPTSNVHNSIPETSVTVNNVIGNNLTSDRAVIGQISATNLGVSGRTSLGSVQSGQLTVTDNAPASFGTELVNNTNFSGSSGWTLGNDWAVGNSGAVFVNPGSSGAVTNFDAARDGGHGYHVGDVLSLLPGESDPGAAGGSVTVTAIASNGEIVGSSGIDSGGHDYNDDDVLSVESDTGSGAQIVITEMDGEGVVIRYKITNAGSGYPVGCQAYDTTSEGGHGFRPILCASSNGGVVSYTLSNGGNNYVTGIHQTAGGHGSGFTVSVSNTKQVGTINDIAGFDGSGSGYSLGEKLRVLPGGADSTASGGELTITDVNDGRLTDASINFGGTGYQVGDVLNIGGGRGGKFTVSAVTPAGEGIIQNYNGTNSATQAGSGYHVGDVLDVSGGTDGQLNVTSVYARQVFFAYTFTLDQAGSGYQAGDTINIGGGDDNGQLTVGEVADSSHRLWQLNYADDMAGVTATGAGYQTGDVVNVDGGSGGTLYISQVDENGGVVSFDINNQGHGYTVGNHQYTTTGGSGSGFVADLNVLPPGGVYYLYTNAEDDGSGYTSGVATTTGGSGSGLSPIVFAGDNSLGFFNSATVHNGGSGYMPGQLVDLSGGNPKAKAYIVNTDNSGAVTNFFIVIPGSGYTPGFHTYTTTGGTGSGFSIDTEAAALGGVNDVSIAAGGTGYSNGAHTTSGGHGTGFMPNVGTDSSNGELSNYYNYPTTGGSGYRLGDLVNVVGHDGSGAQVVVGGVDTSGSVTDFYEISAGSGYGPPGYTDFNTTGGSGTGLVVRMSPQAIINDTISAGSLTAAGTGYTDGATDVASTGGSGSGATFNLSAVANGGDVTEVEVSNPGTGYVEGNHQVAVEDGGSGTGLVPYLIINSADGGNLSQAVPVTAGDYYKVKFTLSNITSGCVDVFLGGIALPNNDFCSNINDEEIIRATNSNALSFNPSTYFAGNITNVSVTKLIGGTPAVSITNARTGKVLGISTGQTGDNIFVGQNSGSYNLGSGNVFIGSQGNLDNINESNKLYVGNASSTLIYGDFVNGYLGINTTTPSHALDVQGDINFTGTLYQNGVAFTGGGSPQWLNEAETSNIYYNSGSVGIGTNNPLGQLDVRTDVEAGLGPVLAITNGGGDTGAAGALDFRTYVVGSEAAEARIQSLDDGNYSSALLFMTKDPGSLSDSLDERMRIASNGNVGIGTNNPQALLDLGGSSGNSIRLTGNSVLTGSGVPELANITDFGLQISTEKLGVSVNDGTSPNFVIDSNGNVGINTTTPGSALTVNGDINFTGNLYQNGVAFTSGGGGSTSGHSYFGNIAGTDHFTDESYNGFLYGVSSITLPSTLTVADRVGAPMENADSFSQESGVNTLLVATDPSPDFNDYQSAGNFVNVTEPGNNSDFSNVSLQGLKAAAVHYTDSNINTIQGADIAADNDGNGIAGSITGISVQGENRENGSAASILGARIVAKNFSTSTIPSGINGLTAEAASFGWANNERLVAATLNTEVAGGSGQGMEGLLQQTYLDEGASVDYLVGLDAGYDNFIGPATVGSRYGIYVEQPQGFNATSSIGNNYGLYVTDQSAYGTSTSYNIYSEGRGQNYFGGNLTVGTTTSNSVLTVNGDINFTGNLLQNGLAISFSGATSTTLNGSTESASFNVSDQSGDPFQASFSTDGMHMYVLDDTGPYFIYQYDLGSAWDVSTASYSGNYLDVNGQVNGGVNSVSWKPDGSELYLVGNNSGHQVIYEYDLGSGWNLSTATYSSNSLDTNGDIGAAQDLNWNADGSKAFVADPENNTIDEYRFDTPYDITSAVFEGPVFGDYFGGAFVVSQQFYSSGTKMSLLSFNPGSGQAVLHGYTLTSPYNVASASSDDSRFNVSSYETSPFVTLDPDGSKFYVMGHTSILQFVMGIKTVGNNSNTLITSSSNLTQVGTAEVGSHPSRLVVSGNYAYVTNQNSNTLSVVDISQPADPVQVSTVSVGNSPIGLAVSGHYAYVVNKNSRNVKVVDVFNASSPVVVATAAVGGDPRGIYISGRYAYVVNRASSTLSVLDISNPAGTAEVATTSVGSSPTDVFVSGHYAYVTNSGMDNTLSIVDISDPLHPRQISTAVVGEGPNRVYVSGRYAYVTNGTRGNTVSVVDVSDPGDPLQIGSIDLGSYPAGLYVSGRYAYVAMQGQDQVDVLDLSNPTSPSLLTTVSVGNSPVGIYGVGNYIYVANQNSNSISIIKLPGTETASLTAHSASVGNLQVANDIVTQGQLQVGTSLNVGDGGILSSGPISVYATGTALNVNGDINFTGRLLQNGVAIAYATTTGLTSTGDLSLVADSDLDGSGLMSFITSGTQRMIITNDGKVGIGTTTPGSALTVVGDINFTGNLLQNGNLQIDSGVSGLSGLRFAQLNSSTVASSTAAGLLGINANGDVVVSPVTSALVSQALAYWDGNNNPTSDSHAYPLATLSGNAGYDGGNGVLLTPADPSQNGSINWSFTQLPFERVQFNMKAGGGDGADSTWFYSYADGVPADEIGDGITNGYIIYFSEYHGCVGLTYGDNYTDGNQCVNGGGAGKPLAASNVSNIGDDNWHSVDISILNNHIIVRWDGVVKIDYTDIYGRDLSNLNFGFGSRTGSLDNNHYIKGLVVTKLGTNMPDYQINPVTAIQNNLWWDNQNGFLGIGTSTPGQQLVVGGNSQIVGHSAFGNIAGIDSINTGYGHLAASTVLNVQEKPVNLIDNGGHSSEIGINSAIIADTSTPESYDNVTGGNFSSIVDANSAADFSLTELTGSVSEALNPGDSATAGLTGLVGQAYNAGNGDTANLTGGYFAAVNSGTGRVFGEGIVGLAVLAQNQGGALNQIISGQTIEVDSVDGSGETGEGLKVVSEISGTSQVDTQTGLEIFMATHGLSSVTNNYGIVIDQPNQQNNNSITNNYGLYVHDQSATGSIQSFNIFSDGSGINYFGGNVGIGTTTPGHLLTLSGGAYSDGNTWQTVSDFNKKTNFATVTPADILQKIAALPITQWNYKTDPATNVHIGPTAQDFYAAFGLGGQQASTSIDSLDTANIALLGVQALNQKVTALQGALVNATSTSPLVVVGSGYFGGDNVGQAKILAGDGSVRVSFSQAYQYQPIVTITPIDFDEKWKLNDVDSTGFTISLGSSQSTDTIFDWQSFSSPSAQLTVSNGTTTPVVLVVPQAPVVPPEVVPEVLGTSTSSEPDVNAITTTTPDSASSSSSSDPVVTP